jgi:predicted hotdog family 3-hydroxylacyl-ACP dehydratase
MLMDRDAIATMIPHQGAMCLLDGLLTWNEAEIRCISRRYAAMNNPLRRADGTLGIATGIEIAAQAMALHGRLTGSASGGASGGAKQGVLASVRDVRFFAGALDASDGALTVAAERLAGDSGGATYHFALSRDSVTILSGRATVLLDIAA